MINLHERATRFSEFSPYQPAYNPSPVLLDRSLNVQTFTPSVHKDEPYESADFAGAYAPNPRRRLRRLQGRTLRAQFPQRTSVHRPLSRSPLSSLSLLEFSLA